MPVKQHIPVVFRLVPELLTKADKGTILVSVIFQVLFIILIVVDVVPCPFINANFPGRDLAAHIGLFEGEPVFLSVSQLEANAEFQAGAADIEVFITHTAAKTALRSVSHVEAKLAGTRLFNGKDDYHVVGILPRLEVHVDVAEVSQPLQAVQRQTKLVGVEEFSNLYL